VGGQKKGRGEGEPDDSGHFVGRESSLRGREGRSGEAYAKDTRGGCRGMLKKTGGVGGIQEGGTKLIVEVRCKNKAL